MEKEKLLQELKKISDHYFDKKDYISAGQINLAMDVVSDYQYSDELSKTEKS